MDSLEASVRTTQVGISDISQRINGAVDMNQGGTRRRADSDDLRHSNVAQEVQLAHPRANDFTRVGPTIGAVVQSVQVNLANAAVQGRASEGDKPRVEQNVGGGKGSTSGGMLVTPE